MTIIKIFVYTRMVFQAFYLVNQIGNLSLDGGGWNNQLNILGGR